LSQGLWSSEGKTPEATVNAQLAHSIKHEGDASLFRRTGKGVFTLANGVPRKPAAKKAETLSFTEAAVAVLKQHGGGPMHYRDITAKALELGLLETKGKTPEATMYAQIIQEHQRRERRGEIQRFERIGKGAVALTEALGGDRTGLERQIRKQNDQVRRELHEQVSNLTPEQFEVLVGKLLTALGFDDVTVTRVSSDGGIDVRGTLVVGDAIRTRMAVQAKKWKKNVQAPIVQQVRGSLGSHEQGLIITTSDFSKGARGEAQRPDATPVGLMNGKQLVSLLIEHGIGVRRTSHDILALDEFREGEE